ncbi:MAG: hypothetical protein NTY19_44005, partial [Planctomycetota bacterium]|nr:hypothetical protein [Planctomycetota bacterium]
MTETPNDGPATQQPRFQFGIRSVLVLTTVCAVAAAIAGSMQVPIAVQVVVALYLIVLATYAVLRLPYICRRILQGIAGLKRLRRQRSDLEAIVSIMQQQLQQAKSTTDTNSTPDPSSPSESQLPRPSVTTPISFGDNVCVRVTPATTTAGLAGLTGHVYGHTTPSVTGVEVIGDLTEDFAVNVHFEDRGESFWFAAEQLEFVDHAPGTEIQLAGVSKKWVRTESGEWQEIELAEKRSETTAPAKRRTRFHQLLLIATFLPLCWFAMMAVHELGHVIGAFASGGLVARVVLHPLTISRTDLSVNPHPLFVAWAGPVAGVLLPLVLLA